VEGSREHGNEPSGFIKCWEVLERLHNWWLLKKDSAPKVSEYYLVLLKPCCLECFDSKSFKMAFMYDARPANLLLSMLAQHAAICDH
jgi:hypothetical protein